MSVGYLGDARTFIEQFNQWQCPRCWTWCGEPTCPGCNHKRVHVAKVVYECQTCLCITTAAHIAHHNCEACRL